MSFASEHQTNILPTMDNDDYDALPVEWPVATHMLAGAAAGVMEHAAMYPIDCVKTQMQSIQTVHYSGLRDAFLTITKKEGAHRLLRGMSAMVVGAGPAHAMYFACYEKVKHSLTFNIPPTHRNSSSSVYSVPRHCNEPFFRGVTARMLYQMPSTAISWSVYEFFKYILYGQNLTKQKQNDKNYKYKSSTWVNPSCPGTIITSPANAESR